MKPLRAIRHRLQPYQVFTCGALQVQWKRHLDGGGRPFGSQLVNFCRTAGMPRQGRVFEWCAGPGFMGFSLLAADLCETLLLADVNPQAITACRKTIVTNQLQRRVTVLQSNNLQQIPADESWDLVVGNPPHFVDQHINNLRAYDHDWQLHRDFFAGLRPHLHQDSVVLLVENNRGSSAKTFQSMLEEHGLQVVYTTRHTSQWTTADHYYVIGCMLQGSKAPGWLAGGQDHDFLHEGDEGRQRSGG